MSKVALYQPDIALNVGAIIRTVACLGGELHIIEPCGFVFDEQKIKRSAMDYYEKVKIIRHDSFEDFYKNEIEEKKSRLILLTTKTDKSYHKFDFLKNDILLFGRESAGVPESVADKSDAKITIPMQNDTRSLNLASSVAIILSHFKISF
jgi:tRNA (cytidine/uridine-2'-O-)-methyltransferase